MRSGVLGIAIALGACGPRPPAERPPPAPPPDAPPAPVASSDQRLGGDTMRGARGFGVAGDGSWFAYATAAEDVVLRDVRTLAELRRIRPPKPESHVCHAVTGSPDGAYVMVVHCERGQLWGTVSVIATKTGAVARTMEAHTLNRGPEMTPDGRYAWIVDRRGDLFRATILDMATGVVRRMDMPDEAKAFALAPDGKTIAVATYSDAPGFHWLEIVEVPTASPLARTTLKTYGASALAYSPDGKRIAGAGFLAPTITEWNAETGTELGSRTIRTSPLDAVWYGPDGTVYSLDEDNAVVGWDASGGARGPYLGPGAMTPSALGFAAGELVAIGPGRGGGVLAGWNQATRELGPIAAPIAADGLAFSPDGLQLHAWSKLTHEVYTLSDGKRSSISRDPAPAGVVLADTMPLPDGDAVVRRQPNLIEVVGAHPRPAVALDVGTTAWIAPSPDGKALAVSDFTQVMLYDVATLKRRAVLGPGRTIAYAWDGARLALAADGATIAIFDVATGRHVGDVARPGAGAITALAFSPDGARIASGAGDGLVVVQTIP